MQEDMREPAFLRAKPELEGCAELIYCDEADCRAKRETFHVRSRSRE